MKRLFSAIAIAATLASIENAAAQAYPSRPITMVVPFPAGSGSPDTVGRIVAEQMRTSLGQPVIVENVAGANGTIGVGRVARAAPDGYTLVLGMRDTLVINGAIFALQYNVLTDFEPVALLASSRGGLFVVKKSMPASDLKGFIAWMRANPDKAMLGHPGIGSTPHLNGIHFGNVTSTRFQFVPYRGSGPAMQDLLAGQIDMMFVGADTALPQVRAGTIKAYGVMAKDRLAAAPEIPTVDEAGLPGLYQTNWYALFAPKGTPKYIIAKLNTAVANALAGLVVRQRFDGIEQEIPARDQQTPEALGALQKADVEKWWPIIKAAGIKAE
jgi:tripartite-type tricarboxylate transporter receptor subunit TctC